MSDKQMTAVEWLWSQLPSDIYKHFLEEFQQSKEIEKQQIIDAWDDGCYQSSDFPKTSDAEQYYDKTYKSK